MKKIYIAMAVIATAALISCQQEKSFNDVKLSENSVVFAVTSGSTRSSEVVSEARQGIVIPLETEDGSKFVLEETVTSLDALMSETRGTPAYTENLGTLYANNLSVYAAEGSFGTATYSNMENSQYPRKDTDLGKGWRYNHDYKSNPWPSSGAVGFYLNMPAEPTNVSITGRTGGVFTFTYTSPASAAAQQDILFAYRSTTKSEYLDDFHPNGIPVLFNHALTAVKFAIGNTDSDISTNDIKITGITFKNLVDKGTCKITPASEDNYKDNPTNYSSANAAKWESLSASGNDITSGEYGNTVNYTSGENNKFGDSWYSAGNNKNLNDADGTQTFWLVPQKFEGSSTTLEIQYTFDGKSDSWEIDFGEALEGVEWKAGELRTYTIKIDGVNVKIEDVVTIVGPTDVDVEDSDTPLKSYKNSTKTAVRIQNTGNTDVYIRAALIGQWLDEESGDPVFGYTDFTSGEFKYVDSWYQDQFVGTKPQLQGKFTDLPGTNWTLEDDGYYYYEDPIAPNAYIPNNLFTKYTVLDAPAAAVSGEVRQIYFQLEIATQAISAKKINGSYYTREEAWARANTPDPQEP